MANFSRTDRKVETTHATIHVVDSRPPHDDPNKPLILLLHGNSFSSLIWRHVLESKLAQIYRIIALDYPGHGQSSNAFIPEQSYNQPAYADTALQVLEQLDPARTIIVVGWSLGGHVAVEMVMRCDRIKGIVITGSPVVNQDDELDKAFNLGPSGWKGSAPARAVITEEEIQGFARGSADPPFENWMEHAVRRTDGLARELMFKRFAEGHDNIEGLEYTHLPGHKWGQRECAEKSEVPIAVINGKDEPFINLEWVRNVKYNNLWRNQCYEMEGSLHAPFWGNPRAYQTLLDDFVADVS